MDFAIIEVTGAPGSGKSTYIKNNLSDYAIFEGYCPDNYNSIQKFLTNIHRLPQIWQLDLNSDQISWFIEMFSFYEESFWARINALRNSVLKFSISSQKLNSKHQEIVVDEGISHIPFIFQLNEKNIQQFVQLFRSYLLKKKIIFIAPPSERELFSRLKKRGHKRATSNEKLKQIININLRTYKNYRMILDRENIPFCVKRNKEAC